MYTKDMLMNDKQRKRNSIYDQAMKEKDNFSKEDLAKLAQGHQFLARLQEDLKYAVDLGEALSDYLRNIADYFHLDRIVILETDLTKGTNTVSYQWNSKKENALVDYFQTMTEEEIASTIATYDKNGYIEVNPTFPPCHMRFVHQ